MHRQRTTQPDESVLLLVLVLMMMVVVVVVAKQGREGKGKGAADENGAKSKPIKPNKS